jgi:hypothetical protein
MQGMVFFATLWAAVIVMFVLSALGCFVDTGRSLRKGRWLDAGKLFLAGVGSTGGALVAAWLLNQVLPG